MIERVPRPTPLPTGLAGWLETFGFPFLDAVPQSEKQSVIKEICDILEVDLKHDGKWECIYMRIRFKAMKP